MTVIFGIPEADVRAAITPVSDTELTDEQVKDRFARVAWSVITEPADRVASALIDALGATGALEVLLVKHHHPITDVLAEIDGAAAVGLDEHTLGAAIERWLPRAQSGRVLSSLQLAAKVGALLLTPDDPWLPSRLHDLGLDTPIALWVRGHVDMLASLDRSVALVGARAATGYGEHITQEFAEGLSNEGYTIVSGAAYGIDGMAHRATMDNNGKTVAVLAGGVDRFYPSGHDALLQRIVDVGVVVSEIPCGAAPTKWRFLKRNRIIAALTQGMVVMEAGPRSGSLNAASNAMLLHRPLGAVPGPITSAASVGCHRLIREFGATCVTSTEDVVTMIEEDN